MPPNIFNPATGQIEFKPEVQDVPRIERWLKGDQGDKGDKGDTGPQGPIGPQGPQGKRGAIGETGATGPIGLQGPQGLSGVKGEKGDIGDSGNPGAPGKNAPHFEFVVKKPKREHGNEGDIAISADGNWFQKVDGKWERKMNMAGPRGPAGSGGGSADATIRSITANATAAATDQVIHADCTLGNIALTLPAAAAGNAGHSFECTKTDASVNTLTVSVSGGGTINGEASQIVSNRYSTLTIRSTGSEYFIV